MKGVIAALCGAVEAVIRICGEAFALFAVFILALAPLAGALAVGYFLSNWMLMAALVATLSLGAIVFRSLRRATDDMLDRSEVGLVDQTSETQRTSNTAVLQIARTTNIVAFHDFDTARNRFVHW
jgi:hypothetical protein